MLNVVAIIPSKFFRMRNLILRSHISRLLPSS